MASTNHQAGINPSEIRENTVELLKFHAEIVDFELKKLREKYRVLLALNQELHAIMDELEQEEAELG